MQIQEFFKILPHLDTINRTQAQQLLPRLQQFYGKLDDQNLSICLYKLTEFIMRIKAVNPEVLEFYEECIKDTIRMVVKKRLTIGTQALRNIFTTESDFYKHVRPDQQSRFPLGLRHPLENYEPQVGQQCDIVKPYLSTITYCGWTRCTVISKDGKRYLVKYANTEVPSDTKQQPFCAPLGTRTQDFEWRMNLKVGDQVDAFHRVWYTGTVKGVEIVNGVKRIVVTFKKYSGTGANLDKFGQRYDGFDDQEDQFYEVTSYRIQMPGKMAKKFCEFSLKAEEFVLDETYDLIFQKQYYEQKFRGLMRLNFTRSLSFLEFYEVFCEEGGNQAFLDLLQNYNKDILDPVFNSAIVLSNTSFLVPKMSVYEYFPEMLDKFLKFLYDNTKNLSPQRNQMASFFIDVIGKRIMSLSQKYHLVNEIRKRLTLDFLKLNMEKQMIALRLLYELINPIPKKYSDNERLEVNQFLRKNDIFYQLIQPQTHEQILSRSIEFVRYLLVAQIISFKQIEYLWNIYPPTDLRGKATVQKMIGELSKNFYIEDSKKVIKKILSYKESELTVDNLTLLRSLKDHKDLQDEDKLQILQAMWEIITTKTMNITEQIEEEIEKVFKSIFPTLQSTKTKLQLLKLILNRLNQTKLLRNEFEILKEFILTYPKKLQPTSNEILKIEEEPESQVQDEKIPSTVTDVVQYLKLNHIYDIIINIFNQLKSQIKMKNVLWFTSFLFEYDDEAVNQIVKIFYEKIGPTEIFFDWAQHITSKAHQFFVEFFNNFEAMNKFENLSNSGFDALNVILLDVNINEGNLKLIKKTKAIAIQSDAPSSTAGSTQKPFIGPVGPEKPEIVTFLYLLKSPYECKGMQFMEELLLVVKNNKVYDEIIKLIIQFFVNLDESIEDRTKEFREQFLMDIILKFREINAKNQYNDKIKLRLEMNVSLLQQLFSQTQKDGLFDISPHFECVEGEIFKFKAENHITKNKVLDPRIEINENATLYSLKVRLGKEFGQKPEDLVVFKFNTPVSDEHNGKSLTDLHFYNDETLKVERKSPKEIPRKQLLNQTGQSLTPKFDSILEKWFDSYKDQRGYMGLDELKKLSGELWRGSAMKESAKLVEIIQKFDHSSKGCLTLQEFKQFFIFKSSQNPTAIWKILNLSGYRNNLRHKDEPQPEIMTSEICPRRILSAPMVYETIFSILQNKTFEPVHLNFYRLLALLQTDKTIKEQVKKHAKEMIQDETSVYKLSYILETIFSEILVNDEFFVEFYRSKGCEFIVEKLKSFFNEENKSLYAMDTLIKTIVMPNMMKILNTYLFCMFSTNKIIRYLKKSKINHIELDFLASQLKKIDQVIGTQNQYENRLTHIQTIQPYMNTEEIRLISEKIMLNLIENYSNQLLQKITNEVTRMYSLMTLAVNKLNNEVMIKGLKCESLNFRRACQNIAYLYLLNNQQELKPFLEILLESLPQQSKVIYSYFFTLLEKVLEMYLENNKDQQDDTEFIELAEKLFRKLFDDLPSETRNSVVADKLLLGVLVVINILLKKRQGVKKHFKYLKKDLLEKCLFFYHPRDRIAGVEITPEMLKTEKQANHFKDYVKCKSQDTRKIMMEIIYHLHSVSAEEDPLFVDQYIQPIFNDLPQQKKKFDTKTMQVGLSNLGSTCYMNCMLQTLNSVSTFRNLIMQTNVNAPLVRELKNLFAYLYFSERHDYIPENLLQAFVPPIMKGYQQDTTEFLNILLDQLDRCLKATESQNLLEQIFQGTQVAQMICESCKQKRERKETFFTYSVDIDGKYDLNSALQGMHNGEVISDCLCEQCGQRADTTKRTIIENVPNMFFIPLKRIVFDYDMFINKKIHTRLEFPTELNFEPYTKEGVELRQSLGVEYLKALKDNEQEKKKFEELCLHGKDKNYYKLKLKGIIVHSGGPDVGHYWAITKKDTSWIKFDDSRVMVFPHSSLESQCYGGNFQCDEWGGSGSSTNAYVLLYEKELKTDIHLGNQENKLILPFDKIETFNTVDLYKEVWLDNHSLMLENHLLRDSFCKEFIHFLVQMLHITPSKSKIRVIAQTLYKVCYHSGETGKLIEAFMLNLDQIDTKILHEYILADKLRTFELLFHNSLSVREFTATFIQKVLIESWKKGTEEERTEIMKLIDEYLGILHHDVAKNWLRIDGYFKLFEGLVIHSLEIKDLHYFLLQKHLISYFIDFIMEKGSPLNIYPKKYSIGTKSNPAYFGNALNLIFFLIKRSFGFTGQNYEIPTIDPNDLFHLSDNDVLCLSSITFYQKMIRERQNLEVLGSIIQRLSIMNLLFSEAVARVMLICLNQITDLKDEMIDICGCIAKYLHISDEFWTNRAEFVIGYSSPYMFKQNLLTSLDEDRFVYTSTLEDLFPVECLLAYCYIHRLRQSFVYLRNPLAVLHIIRTILEGCTVNNIAKQYLLSQKSPSYYHERYIDWLSPYVNNVVETLHLSNDKKQSVLKEIEICSNYLNDIEMLKKPLHNVITGKILNQNVVDRFMKQDIEVVISNVECFMLKSEPTGFGNRALDQFLDHGRLNKKVTKESNILGLFDEFCKPLAIKQNVEEAEDKEIESLFDDCIDPRQADKKMEIQQPVKNSEPKPQKIVTEVPQQAEKKEQDKIYEINVPGIYISPDYFRKIQIINNSSKTKRVTVHFRTNENSNMLVPSKIYFKSTKKAVETMWICKIDESKGWGIADYELEVDEKEPKSLPKSFKLYGQIQQDYKPDKMEIQGQNEVQNSYNTDMTMNNGGYEDVVTEISCPICTLLNLSTETNCDACGSSLRG